MGNASIPQRQEHEQEPSAPVEPLPAATLGVGGAADAAAGGAAADEAGGGAAAALDAGGAPAVAVPFCCMAIAWNMAWVLAAVGLMLKVMPLPQCPFCLQ